MPATLAALALLVAAQAQDNPDAELSARRFRLAPGLKVELFAAEPQLENPVCIAFDEKGRLYVGETHRRHTSLPDINMFRAWLDEDVACRRHEDQVAMMKRHLGDKAAAWTRESERIRLLEDTDGDGRADRATTFAEGFNDLGEGLGAGLLVRGRDVWYTCIPNLWLLRDTDGDGKADERKPLHTGFGVRIGMNGHDLHGLRWGPDGKIYFSCGDRGFHVETGGKAIDNPDSGGVLRCNPDGSDLELIATGLRNPQELAFDQFGNLFTGDNNGNIGDDNGDSARWIYVVEGADYGWRQGFQWMTRDCPWSAEGWWKGAAPFLVPRIAHLGHGPSGNAFYPGTGLPARYDGHFLLCDFPGGIWSFAMKPKGAGFEMVDLEKFLWEILAPDVDFGPDGAVYVADWVATWDKTDKGRIFRITHPETVKDAAVAEVKKLLAEGMGGRAVEQLDDLMAHRDQRVRQAAQFELVTRGKFGHAHLAIVAGQGNPPLARLHAVWGLGQAKSYRALMPLLEDPDPEVRAQAARVLGDGRVDWAGELLVPLLKDDSPRVRFFAAMAIGRLGYADAFAAVLDLVRANGDEDPFLRHAAVMALAGIGKVADLVKLSKDPLSSVRLAALLALRRLRSEQVFMFLHDPDLDIRFEAARAINDTPIEKGMRALAKAIQLPDQALTRRINACYREGDAEALALLASRRDAPAAARVEALKALMEWEKPSGRDRVIGVHRPLAARDGAAARDYLGSYLLGLLADPAPDVAAQALRAARQLRAPGFVDRAVEILNDRQRPPSVRLEALRAIAEPKDNARLAAAVEVALGDADEALRTEAMGLLARAGQRDAASRLEKIALEPGTLRVRQAAIKALASAPGAEQRFARLVNAEWPDALRLDVLDAAGKPAEWIHTLQGGDAGAGRRVFFEHKAAQCSRCHWVRMEGGSVGPELTAIGAQRTREQLLDSIVSPNKEIAPGFEQAILGLKDGGVEVGKVEIETDADLTLRLADGSIKKIRKAAISERKKGLSSMPEDIVKNLTKREVRDLVEFLSTLK